MAASGLSLSFLIIFLTVFLMPFFSTILYILFVDINKSSSKKGDIIRHRNDQFIRLIFDIIMRQTLKVNDIDFIFRDSISYIIIRRFSVHTADEH